MRHNLCRSFHPWCPGVKNRCLSGHVMLTLSADRWRSELQRSKQPDITLWWPASIVRNMAAHLNDTWWRHQMETFSASLTLCAGNSPVTGEFPSQRPVTRMFSLICAWTNGWVNTSYDGDLRHHRTHYDVTVMKTRVDFISYEMCYI